MYSLRKFNGRTGNIGQALPDVFPSFALARITFRQGATSMIAGPPGSFKSVTALNLIILPLDTASGSLNHAGPGRNWTGQIYVATPSLLRAFGIKASQIDSDADLLDR